MFRTDFSTDDFCTNNYDITNSNVLLQHKIRRGERCIIIHQKYPPSTGDIFTQS